MPRNVVPMPKYELKDDPIDTPYGYQPVRNVLDRQGISQKEAAKGIGVPWSHFRRCITGRTRPMDIVREKLPTYLGVPLEELFTPELLAKPYEPHTVNAKPRPRTAKVAPKAVVHTDEFEEMAR